MILNVRVTSTKTTEPERVFTFTEPSTIYKELAMAFYASIKKRPHKTIWKKTNDRNEINFSQYYTEEETKIDGFSVKYEYDGKDIYL